MKLMTDLVGRTLGGRYRLDARRAAGASGDAYAAYDHLLQRELIVKVAQGGEIDTSSGAPWRMVAQAAARLSHPNVVRVHDWGIEDDLVYLVTETVSGTDARDLLVAKGSIEPLQAAEIIACVCDALVASHSLGLIHHDIRPENILITQAGEVKVADFGIAPVTRDGQSLSSGMTNLRYMSPEEAAGLPPTASSDIWAAGAVLAEMLTGKPPQQGAGTDLSIRRAADHPIAPSLVDPGVPTALDEIVMKACALDPADRYADASDMAHALRRASVRVLPDAPKVEELMDEITGEIDLTELQDRKEPRKEKPASKRKGGVRIGRLALLMLLLGALIGGAIVGFASFLAPDMIDVPRLGGLTLADARGNALDFDVAVSDREYHDSIPRGAVIEQSPDSGEAEEGSDIDVVLSLGPPPVRVPQLGGSGLDNAREEIESLDLVVGKTLHRYAPVPEGKVVKQLPSTGKLAVGSEVHLVVSKGPRPVELPAIAGAPAADATDALSDVGLRAKISKVFSDEAEPGLVLYSDPEAGSTVSRGEAIEVFVSAGPQFKDVTVPEVRNLSPEKATAKLETAGLQADVVTSCGGGDLVVDTSPVTGSTLQENDSVTLFVC